MDLLQGTTFKMLQSSLDATALRQKVIANNIANAETPNFKRSELRFAQYLQDELAADKRASLQGKVTNERHIPIHSNGSTIHNYIHKDPSTAMNNNLNNVDIDVEMVHLAENQMNYNVLIQQANHHFKMTRTAISRGNQ